MNGLFRRYYMMLDDRFGSPYDAAATAYLKMTYADYWWQIIKYGSDHREMVPWINEDPDLICSLIDVGVTRYLKAGSDVNSYIETGVKAVENTLVRTRFLYNSATIGLFGCREVADPYGSQYYVRYNPSDRYTRFVNNYANEAGGASPNVGVNNLELKKNVAILNGTTYSVSYNTSPTVYTIWLMAISSGGSLFSTIGVNNGAEYFYMEGGSDGKKHYWVPFVSQSRNGMLDIQDLTQPVFYPNAGTGTFTTAKVPTT